MELSKNCDLGNQEDTLIKYLFIANMQDPEIQREVLRETHMFGDSSQDVFSAVGFLRAQVFCTSGRLQQIWRSSWARSVLHL